MEQEEADFQDVANDTKSTHRNLIDTLWSHTQVVHLCGGGFEHMWDPGSWAPHATHFPQSNNGTRVIG